jgi:hypothetical protein
MSHKFLIASAALLAAVSAQAAVSVTGPAFTYSQNFDSLASTGTTATWVNDSTLAGWSLFYVNTDVTSYLVGTGSGTSGGFYSYGSAGSTDRALGSLATNGNVAAGANEYIALSLTNTSGAAFDSFTLRYDGEQWRNAGNTAAQTLTVQYGFGATFAAVTTWNTTTSAFTFTSPVASATAAAVDGNAAGLVGSLGGTVSTTWAAGDTMWIRWTDLNDSGNDHGLAIDNVSLSVSAVPEPSTYAMLLAGVAAIGFVARRRRNV